MRPTVSVLVAETVPMLTVVSPVRDEEAGLRTFVEQITEVLARCPVAYELILVDDGSTDGSWKVITELASGDEQVRGLSLSRNFGKDAAIMAGIAEACGDAVAVLDADLQHPPALLVEMIELWQAGAEVVEAVKLNREGQPFTVRVGATAFNRVFRRFTGVDLTGATDYRLLSRPVIDALLSLPEHAVFFRGTSSWVGFDRQRIAFRTDPRAAGSSRWSLRALARFAVRNVTSFSSAPLHVVTLAGVLFAVLSVLLGVQTLVRWMSGDAVEGFTTVILLLLIQGSLILIGLGIIGEYLARVHDEVKARPRYVVAGRTADHRG
jgi:polyisoprenyl-phosphate glycosyltransferase